ncbi:MAG: HEAT repeat domain-containing protein, partial [Myxococcales bacterium]|nr:HEAT repeat domain-containing protein [Myxococcales bacterium]
MSEQGIVTGADDWRSESEKRRSILRKALINLLKLWIPDHPEAGMQKAELNRNWRDAMDGWADRITLVSLLSSGVEDLMVYDFERSPVSVQSLLVQREGTDAFLDARNALRVVRRKFGMMTLIARTAGVFEQRNMHALTLDAGMSEGDLLAISRLLSTRIEGTSAEEEQRFRMALRRAGMSKLDVLFHNDVIGRRLPVAWPVKAFYSQLARRIKAGQPHPDAAEAIHQAYGPTLGPKGLSDVAQYADNLGEDLEAPGGYNPADLILVNAEEEPLLAVTRRLYDDFNLLRREREHERAMGGGAAPPPPEPVAAEVDAEMDFLGETSDQDDDQLLRLANALERIRRVRGRAFFGRMSMIGEQVDFFEAAEATSFEDIEQRLEAMDPQEGLGRARAIREPFYRARALEAAARRLMAAGNQVEAAEAAREALTAARGCHGEDKPQAYAAALSALLGAQCIEESGEALHEALKEAHTHEQLPERAAALMRVASTVMQAGPLPAELRGQLSHALLGDDVHFWGKPEVTPALVEACLSLLSALDDDTFIFLQKVIAHPEEEVRRSVIRAMPFGTDATLRNMLLSHLRDPSPDVRLDVVERVGNSGDRSLFIYLVNHLRHGEVERPEELRALALGLCRLDIPRALPVLNAMLGKLATPDERLVGQQAPFKAGDDMQLAALEALYAINSRESRRLIFNVREKARKGPVAETASLLWQVVKARPYGEPELPRSPHDPEWLEDVDGVDLATRLQAILAEEAGPEPEPEPLPEIDEADLPPLPPEGEQPSGGGLFGRLKRKLFKQGEAAPAA